MKRGAVTTHKTPPKKLLRFRLPPLVEKTCLANFAVNEIFYGSFDFGYQVLVAQKREVDTIVLRYHSKVIYHLVMVGVFGITNNLE